MAESPGSPSPSFERLASISESATAVVDLCRMSGGEHDGMLVALKRPRLEASEVPQVLAMFRDETAMTSSLQHEHIVRLVCWGKDDQGPYFATEFVRGVSTARLLRTVVKTGDSFPERIVAAIAVRICRGLAAAHTACSPTGEPTHLVHRDLTPDNVLLGFEGEVKISDFGLAKTKQCTTQTMTGQVKGTCEYMAPEQIRAQPLDGRVDIFALGVMMFELLTGRRPWQGRTPAVTMQQIVDDPPPSLGALRPGLQGRLVSLVESCLAKDPDARVQSAAGLGDELKRWMLARGYPDKQEQLARFVRRHAMRQMRWCERAIAGELAAEPDVDVLESPWAAEDSDGAPSPVGRVVVAGPGGERARPRAPTEPMRAVSTAPAQADAPPNIRAEDADDAPTLAQDLDHAAAFSLSSTQPDLDLAKEDTLDTGHTMPSALVGSESLDGGSGAPQSGRARPVFVALPRSTPPAAAAATKGRPRRESPAAAHGSEPARRAPLTPMPDTVTDVGPQAAVVFRDARAILAEAAGQGVKSDRAAREAFDAAQRARLAAEAAQAAAARAEGSARAAVLAQRAIAAVEAGDLDGGIELLERAKELRRGVES